MSDVRVIKSSKRDKIESEKPRRFSHSSHDYEKKKRDTETRGQGYHQNFENPSKSSDIHARRVVDKRTRDYGHEKEKVGSRAPGVPRQERERLFLVTVENDVRMPKHSVPSAGETYRNRSSRVAIKKAENGKSRAVEKPEREEESSDVDSDYTIEMRSQKGSDEDSVYSVEFTNIGGSEDEDSDMEKAGPDSETVEEEDGKMYDLSEDADFEKIEVSEEVDGSDSEKEESGQDEKLERDKNSDSSDDISRHNSDDNVGEDCEFIKTAEVHENINKESSGRRTVVIQSSCIESEAAESSEKGTRKAMPEKAAVLKNVVSEDKPNQDTEKKLELATPKVKARVEIEDDQVQKLHNAESGNGRRSNATEIVENKSYGRKPSEELLESKKGKIRDEKLKDEANKGGTEKGDVVARSRKDDTSKDRGRSTSSLENKVLGDGNNKTKVRNDSETGTTNAKYLKNGNSDAGKKDRADTKGLQTKKGLNLESQSKSKETTESARKTSVKDSVHKSEKRATESMAARAGPEKAAAEDPKCDNVTQKNRSQKVTPKSYRMQETGHKKLKEKEVRKDAPTGGKNRRTRAKSSSEESSCSTCSGSGSSSSGSSSNSSRSDSESDHSSASESESSSASSQSSSSDSASSSSGDDNFKRRKRRDSEKKSYDNAGKVNAKVTSSRKDRGRGYVSPLRTSKSHWGRPRTSDERSRQKPSGQRTNESTHRSRLDFKEKGRYRSRSRSRSRSRDTRGRGRGRSQESERKKRYSAGRSGTNQSKEGRYDRRDRDRQRTGPRQQENDRLRNTSRERKRTPDRKAYGKEKSRPEVIQKDRGTDNAKGRGLERKKGANAEEKVNKEVKEVKEVRGEKEKTRPEKEPKTLSESKKSKSPVRIEQKPIGETKSSANSGKLPVVQAKSSDIASQRTEDKPKPLMEQKIGIRSIEKAKGLTDKVKLSKSDQADTTKVVPNDKMDKSHVKKSPDRTEDERKREKAGSAPRPLMEITLANVKKPVSDRLSRRVSVSKKSAFKDDGHQRRRVTRVNEYGADANGPKAVEKSRESQAAVSSAPSTSDKPFLKRLSSGKSVMIERNLIEPLMKEDDIEFGIVTNPRIVERKHDDHHIRSVRRVVSNSGPNLSSAVVEVPSGVTEDAPPPPKRKVFSRLGKTVISKSKNIAINLKPTLAKDAPDKEVPAAKNEDEVELDARIKQIREKNEEILRRQREIERDILINS